MTLMNCCALSLLAQRVSSTYGAANVLVFQLQAYICMGP